MKTFTQECRERAEDAKLSSDDHGHDCTALREYCETELIYAYDNMVPELCRRLERAIEGLRDAAMAINDGGPEFTALADELERP